jgi:hypothetical protein
VSLGLPLPDPLPVAVSRKGSRALGPAARWVVETVSAAIPPVRAAKAKKGAKPGA